MMEIVYSPTAIEDLQHSYKYILDNWGENTAKRVQKKIVFIRILNERQKFVDHLFYGVKENNENIKKDNE